MTVNNGRIKLSRLTLEGFKSIDKAGQTIDFGDVTVLLGANGAGKSNLISFFRMLNSMTTRTLQGFIGEQGYAGSILHFGVKVTNCLKADLVFSNDDNIKDCYRFTLSPGSSGDLMFSEESITWDNKAHNKQGAVAFGSGHKESSLSRDSQTGGTTSQFVLNLLENCKVFHFHDTSSTAEVKSQGYIDDNEFLRSNAGNLAAFLYVLKNRDDWRKNYDRIVRYIQLILPQFDNFILNPSPLNKAYIKLDWKEKDSDYRFGPHQLSDGSLRFMALAALLLQPQELLPKVVILDEPELGLHPAAIGTLVGMIRSAAVKSQIVLATQATRMVNEFKADEIVVVEYDRIGKRSIFRRPADESDLSEWLERYCLADLWEKNVLGGRPS